MPDCAGAPPLLGVLLNAEYPLAQLVELGRLSERLGYQHVWLTDVRFLRECYLSLAAVAGCTERILLGTGVTDPYTRHPAITAASIATLDELSGGRALLGLGVGGGSIQELGIAQALPVAALREAVDVIRGLLRGEEVTVQGKVVTLTRGKLQFTPPRAAIPIYFATHGAQVMRLAGQVADGVLLANTLAPAALDFYLGKLAEGQARAGRPPGSVAVCLRLEAAIADDEEAALAVMHRRVGVRIAAQYPHWGYLERFNLTLPPTFVDAARRKDYRAAVAALPDEAAARMVLAGRPDRVARQVADILRPEVTQITIRPHPIPGQGPAEVIEAFAHEVMPRVVRLMGDA